LSEMNRYRVDKNTLEELLLDKTPISSWDDVAELCPSLLIDFDRKRLMSLFPEPASFEDYVPEGWSGEYGNFLDQVPEEQRYWTINGKDVFHDLQDRGMYP